jgi:hypothetical protein
VPSSTAIINGPTSIDGAAVAAGALKDCSWDMSVDRPGEVSSLGLVFETSGELKAGSTIVLKFPHTLSSSHQRSWTLLNAVVTDAEKADPWWLDTSAPSVRCAVGSSSVAVSTTSWSRLTGVLKVTLMGAIDEFSSVSLQVAGVGTPSSVVSVSVAELKTLDGSDVLIDGPVSVATEATTVGAMGGALTWASASDIAGVTSTVTVSFSVGGWVPKGGTIELELPVVGESDGVPSGDGVPSDGWRPYSDSVVASVSPAGYATGVVHSSLGKVVLTTEKAVRSNQTIAFEVTRMKNPSSVTGAANVVVVTKDLHGVMIDGPTNVGTDAITAGSLTSPMSWVAGTRTPGVTATATLSFNVTGSVAVGGTFVVVLPSESMVGCDSTWSMPAAPTVLVSSPELVLAAGTWASGTQTLEITTARSMIEEGTRVVIEVSGVRAPSCVHSSTSASVHSVDSAGGAIDAPTNVSVATIMAGHLRGDVEWEAARPIAAVTSDSIVQFMTSGGIPSGGSITIVLPPEGGWSMPSTPNIQFSKPSSVVDATAVWNLTTNTLVLTLSSAGSSAIGEAQLVVLTIKSTNTPKSMQPARVGSIYTTGPSMRAIDGPAAMNISAIGSTQHVGRLLWDPAHDTAATETSVEVSFTHVGSIEQGGFVHITLDENGWDFTSAEPTVTFQLPSNMTAAAAWQVNESTLELQITSGSVHENTDVRFVLGGVITPAAARPTSTAALRTYTKARQFVHGPTVMAMQAVVAGALTGVLKWEPAIKTPGVTSSANVTFQTNGQLDNGASLAVDLPCGWAMPSLPTVKFMNPAGLVASTTSFTSDSLGSRLEVVLNASAVSGRVVPAQSKFHIIVSDVTTPSHLQTASTGAVSTIATPSTCSSISSGTGSGCIVDGPTAISFSATEQANFVVQRTAKRPRFATPGSLMETFEIQVINPRRSCTDAHSQDRDLDEDTRGCLHRTGPGTEFEDVECEMVAQEIHIPVYNPDGSFKDPAHSGLQLKTLTSAESDIMLGGSKVQTMLIRGSGTAVFGPTRLLAVPGSTVQFQMSCRSGDTSGDGVSKYTFTPVSVQVKVRRYKLQLSAAPPAWIFGSAMRGSSINADHVRDANFFEMSVQLVLDDNQDCPVPACADHAYSYSQLIGDGARSTTCVASVRVSDTNIKDGYTARMLTSHSTEPVVVHSGVARFRDVAIFAGAVPNPNVSYSTNQHSTEMQIMHSLPMSDQRVFLDINCNWAGDESIRLPPLYGNHSGGASLGIQNLKAAWKSDREVSIVSETDISEYFELYITNQMHHAHTELPYPQCALSIWTATVLGKLVVDLGVETAEMTDKLRPELSGVVDVQVVEGNAIFKPLQVSAQLGSEFTFRALCHGSTWMDAIYTPLMKVRPITLRWVRAPPILVKLGDAVVQNTFRTTNATGYTTDSPIAIKLWDDEKGEISTGGDCVACCTVRVNSSFQPYVPLVESDDLLVESVTKYKVFAGDIADVTNGIATFKELVVGFDAVGDPSNNFGDQVEFRVNCNFRGNNRLPIKALYYPDITTGAGDGRVDGNSSVQHLRTAIVGAPTKAVRTEKPLNEEVEPGEGIQGSFTVEIQKLIKDTDGNDMWIRDDDDVTTECKASVDYGDWTATIPSCDDSSRCKCDRAGDGTGGWVAINVTSCTGGTCDNGTPCTCPGADGTDNVVCADKEIVNEYGTEYFRYSQLVTETTMTASGASIRSRQVGASIGGTSGTEKLAERGVISFADLVFSKIGVGEADRGLVEFQGVGGKLYVSFLCKGAMELPVVFRKVDIRKCGDGEEPSSDKARCNQCGQYSFKVGKSTKCMPCPGLERKSETSSVIRYAQAESNAARTSCECPYEFYAAKCPKYRKQSGSIWCERRDDETADEAARRAIAGKSAEEGLAASGTYQAVGDAVEYQETEEHWGHVCVKCPTGGVCTRKGTTFNNLQAEENYWQDKSNFIYSNAHGNDEENLVFAKCAVLSDGSSACIGGEYSLDDGGLRTSEACVHINITNNTLPSRPLLAAFEQYDLNGDGKVSSGELQPYRNSHGLIEEYSQLDHSNTSILDCSKVVHNGCRAHHGGPLCDQCVEDEIYGEDGSKLCFECANDHRGDDCGRCIIKINIYVKNGDGICEKCPEDGTNMNKYYYIGGIFVFVAMVVVIFRAWIKQKIMTSKDAVGKWFEHMAANTMMDHSDNSDLSEEQIEDMNQMAKEDFLDDFIDKLSRKWKIFISFLQVVGSFTANFGTIEWPLAVRNMSANFQFVNINIFSSTDALCTTRYSFLDIFVVNTTWPIVFCLLIFSAHLACKRADRFFLRESKWVYKICLQVLFLVYPSTSNTILRMFTCIEPGLDGKEYLQADTQIRCDCEDTVINGITTCVWQQEELFQGWILVTFQDLRLMAMIMVLVYPIGFPLSAYLCLWFNKEDLYVRQFTRKQQVRSLLHGEGVIRKVHDVVGGRKVHDHKLFTYDVMFDYSIQYHFPLKAIRVSKELLMPLEGYPGLYCDHEGHFTEVDEAWGDKLGFLYDSYEPHFWWWEEVEMMRKLVLTGIITFIKPNTPLQMAAGCMLSLLMIIINANFKPYLEDEDDMLQLCCSVAIFTSYFSGFMLCFSKYEIEGYEIGDNFGMVMVFINVIPLFVGIYILGVALIAPCCKVANAKAFKRRQKMRYKKRQNEEREKWEDITQEIREGKKEDERSRRKLKLKATEMWNMLSQQNKTQSFKSRMLTMKQSFRRQENAKTVQRASMNSSMLNIKQIGDDDDSDGSQGSDWSGSDDGSVNSDDWTASDEEYSEEDTKVKNPKHTRGMGSAVAGLAGMSLADIKNADYKAAAAQAGEFAKQFAASQGVKTLSNPAAMAAIVAKVTPSLGGAGDAVGAVAGAAIGQTTRESRKHDGHRQHAVPGLRDDEDDDERSKKHIHSLKAQANKVSEAQDAIKLMRQDFPDVGKMVRLHGLKEKRFNHKVAVVKSKTMNGRYRVLIWGDGRQLMCEERNMTVILSKKEKEANRKRQLAMHTDADLSGQAPVRPEDAFGPGPLVPLGSRARIGGGGNALHKKSSKVKNPLHEKSTAQSSDFGSVVVSAKSSKLPSALRPAPVAAAPADISKKAAEKAAEKKRKESVKPRPFSVNQVARLQIKIKDDKLKDKRHRSSHQQSRVQKDVGVPTNDLASASAPSMPTQRSTKRANGCSTKRANKPKPRKPNPLTKQDVQSTTGGDRGAKEGVGAGQTTELKVDFFEKGVAGRRAGGATVGGTSGGADGRAKGILGGVLEGSVGTSAPKLPPTPSPPPPLNPPPQPPLNAPPQPPLDAPPKPPLNAPPVGSMGHAKSSVGHAKSSVRHVKSGEAHLHSAVEKVHVEKGNSARAFVL